MATSISGCPPRTALIIFIAFSLGVHHASASSIKRQGFDPTYKTTSRTIRQTSLTEAESPSPDASPSVTPTISPTSPSQSPDSASPPPLAQSAASEAIGSPAPLPSSIVTLPAATPPATSATTDTTTSSGSAESKEAFEAFNLRHRRENHSDSSDAFDDRLIFANGTLADSFAKNPSTSSLDDTAGTSDVNWYVDDDYLDRIAFHFTFTVDNPAYAISKPELFTSALSGIEPSVVSFQINAEEGFGSFTIMYKCRPAGTKKNLIAMHFPITKDYAVDTTWIKTCGSGHFHYLIAGFTDHKGDTSEFNPDGSLGEEERRKLEVGPMDASTQFNLHVKPPAENLDFEKPYIESSSNNIGVQLRGTINAGTFSGDADTSLTVLYDCKKATSATMRLTMAIPPWDNVTIEWRKDCGGSHSQALQIGSEGPRSYDIMQGGEISSQFNISEDATVGTVGDSVTKVPAKKNAFRISLSNDDSTSDIHIQTISLTMSDPEIVDAAVSVPTLSTGNFLSQNGGVLRRHESMSLLIRLICKKAGSSIVLVTLPTVRYKNVEFGFVKECDQPTAHTDSGFLTTAGSLLTAILVLVIGSGCALCYYTLRKRRATKYEAVPTSEA